MPPYTSVFDFPCDGLHHIGVTSAESSVSGWLLERFPLVNQPCPLTMPPVHLVGDGAAPGGNNSSAIAGV
ncbi:uncharacterized protein LAESUDRAFT_722238 [Laetiporus sulphureus 93-53]|uniref:Uncharacterized protein n=1 Tax=Laetiporus sulphureus 93-53 TaxID=1314785 RepID=A0A165GAW4_9APHY|nr:uncharacterized protein LAESUDRAFT_722238 [Laetiporus sulphureus 93-53]KZT10089.1 hypothetical protein LAESUDRAFT_722238 [Laetiporus sulphureus 93-53]